MDNFFDKIKKQLRRMTEAEKDAWILSQTKILPEFRQEDFYKSICGTKKVINMPKRSEITGFCEKVRNGDAVVEYKTHYVEFNDYRQILYRLAAKRSSHLPEAPYAKHMV